LSTLLDYANERNEKTMFSCAKTVEDGTSLWKEKEKAEKILTTDLGPEKCPQMFSSGATKQPCYLPPEPPRALRFSLALAGCFENKRARPKPCPACV
jgi:hypothetical protein